MRPRGSSSSSSLDDCHLLVAGLRDARDSVGAVMGEVEVVLPLSCMACMEFSLQKECLPWSQPFGQPPHFLRTGTGEWSPEAGVENSRSFFSFSLSFSDIWVEEAAADFSFAAAAACRFAESALPDREGFWSSGVFFNVLELLRHLKHPNVSEERNKMLGEVAYQTFTL
jgi:hypothetical protein